MMIVEVGAWDCCIGFQSPNYDVLEWKSLFSYCGNTTCVTSSGDTAGFDCEICGTLSAVEVRLTPSPGRFRNAPALVLNGRSFGD
jgi:hypothetical protein